MSIHVNLTEEEGNAMAIIGRVRRGLIEAGVNTEVLKDYFREATLGTYDGLLQTSMDVLDKYHIDWS